MSAEKIKFSYLELTDSNFNIPIYRKSYDSLNITDDIYRYSLTTASGKDRDTYAVSFLPMDDGIPYSCNSYENIHLTKKWLMLNLVKRVEATFKTNEYYVGKHFIPNLSFVMASFKEGQQVIQMEPYYLEANNSFGFLLDFKFKAFRGFEKTRQEKILSLSISNDGLKNKNFYTDKFKLINGFITNTINILFPFISDGVNIDLNRTLTELPTDLLNEKVYVFKNGQSPIQFQGLKEYKPLGGVAVNPLFVFVFEKSKTNTARQLVKALRGQLYPTFSGLEDIFSVKFLNENITSITVDNFTKENLQFIGDSLDNIVKENPTAQIVGVFVGIAKDFDTGKDYSPYYTVKSSFLKHGLAIQAITIEQALKNDGFKWAISGIALQLFVKLGGQPWKVKPQNDNCLIFGISSAHIRDDNNHITKYFAYSLCFDSSGLYRRLDILGQASDEKTYMEQLAEQIRIVLKNELDAKISKCVIHVPFKIKKKEIQCIKDSINTVKGDHQQIEFVVIKINVDNKFFGYSEYNSRIPLAGNFVSLGAKEFLVWFEGLQQNRPHVVSAQNISNPVHIQFWDSPTLSPEEIRAYMQDILNLSGANWRGFNAKHEPVTTLYPELFARFAGKFNQYGLDMSIGEAAIDKVWFI